MVNPIRWGQGVHVCVYRRLAHTTSYITWLLSDRATLEFLSYLRRPPFRLVAFFAAAPFFAWVLVRVFAAAFLTKVDLTTRLVPPFAPTRWPAAVPFRADVALAEKIRFSSKPPSVSGSPSSSSARSSGQQPSHRRVWKFQFRLRLGVAFVSSR
jgi:hypothetical protein